MEFLSFLIFGRSVLWRWLTKANTQPCDFEYLVSGLEMTLIAKVVFRCT